MTVRRWTKHDGINYPVFFSRSDKHDIQIKQAYPAKIQTFQEVVTVEYESVYTPCVKCGQIIPGEMITIAEPDELFGEMICERCWDEL